jgi:hypothetical protein
MYGDVLARYTLASKTKSAFYVIRHSDLQTVVEMFPKEVRQHICFACVRAVVTRPPPPGPLPVPPRVRAGEGHPRSSRNRSVPVCQCCRLLCCELTRVLCAGVGLKCALMAVHRPSAPKNTTRNHYHSLATLLTPIRFASPESHASTAYWTLGQKP